MRIGFVGCGYTADGYIKSLKNYYHLELSAVTDSNQKRALEFGAYYSVKTYPTVEALLADPTIEMIVNLTTPSSHFEVSKVCLEAGKHVYSEKPLAMTFSQAQSLVELANRKSLYLSSAPCNILGEMAQTLWKALRNSEIGTVRVVYAELDDGPVHLQDPDTWHSVSGAPFLYREEFEAGCTLEHAEYYLTWFTAFFGPAKTITAYSACLWPDKQVVAGEPLYVTAPDFSVACITFESGVVARLTCSLVAPHNHGMRIVGDKGVLVVEECFNYSAPVYVDRYSRFKFRAERYPITKAYAFIKNWFDPHYREYPPVKKFSWRKRNARFRQDYARGVAEVARAIMEQRPSRLPADYCLHVTELIWAIDNATSMPYQVTTTFKPLQPMDDVTLKEVLSIDW
ncbi:MAG: Gfo/Idh/MocA family protein [Syntrophobacteraceae bacterium]